MLDIPCVLNKCTFDVHSCTQNEIKKKFCCLKYFRISSFIVPPQNCPVNPAGHVQLNPSSCSKHVAPFKQGSWKHSRSTKDGNKDMKIRKRIRKEKEDTKDEGKG